MLIQQGPQGEQGLPGDTGDAGTGISSLINTSDEPAGDNCENGGIKIEVGLDENGNGVLDAEEVVESQTRYICNGNDGQDGVNSSGGSVSFSDYIDAPDGVVSTLTNIPVSINEWSNQGVIVLPMSGSQNTTQWAQLSGGNSNVKWVDDPLGVLDNPNSYYPGRLDPEVINEPNYERIYQGVNAKNLEFIFNDMMANRFTQIQILLFDSSGNLITGNYSYKRSSKSTTPYSTNSTSQITGERRLYAIDSDFIFFNYNNSQNMFDTIINVSTNQIISEIKVVFSRSSAGPYYANWTGQLWISKH